jgi:hypothetical protein
VHAAVLLPSTPLDAAVNCGIVTGRSGSRGAVHWEAAAAGITAACWVSWHKWWRAALLLEGSGPAQLQLAASQEAQRSGKLRAED